MTEVMRCDFRLPFGSCGREPARRYLPGDRCTEHAPAALNGRTVPTPPAGTTLRDLLAAVGKTSIGAHQHQTVLDDRAIASGKRRSSLTEYRDAVAREDERRQA